MHPLLLDQLHKHLGSDVAASDSLHDFLEAVSETYAAASPEEVAPERRPEEFPEADQELKHTVSLLQAALDATGDGILVVDYQGRVTEHNDRFVQLLGLPGSRMDGWDANAVLELFAHHLTDPAGFVSRIHHVIADPDRVVTTHIEMDGDRHVKMHSQPQKVAGNTVGRVWSFHDISDLKRAEAIIRQTAYRDPLTKLPNRALFDDRFAVSLARAKRKRTGLGVFFIDLDGFKKINDSLGHAAGDRLLRTVAARLAAHVREGDTLARFGGDEFVFAASDMQSEDAARIVASRLLAAVSPPVEIEGHTVRVTASIGVALYPDTSRDAQTLIRCADTALYTAKDLGRNTFQIYRPDISERNLARVRLEQELRTALDQGHLTVAYQPQVCARSGRIMCLEALSRWPRGAESVGPDVFIPLAEEAGIVDELGRCVLEKCATTFHEWRTRTGDAIRIAVNVSPLQIQRPGFSHRLIALMDDAGIPPHCLELEVTESGLKRSGKAGLEALSDLAALGFRIALDDFGSASSALEELRGLPLTTIKIDREFVQRCHVSPQDLARIEAIVSVARGLGLTVVAEGVELPEQVAVLQRVGCDLIQGYATGRPMDHAALSARQTERVEQPRTVNAMSGAATE